MAADIKKKEIQIQRPAQSLQAFQKKMATGQAGHATLLKPLLICLGIVAVLTLSWFGFSAWRSNKIEKHETALASLMRELEDPSKPAPQPEEMEKLMRERLPRLEALAKSAPGPCRANTQALLESWRLQLDGRNTLPAAGSDPWSRLNLAKRAMALGNVQEAQSLLAPLRRKADRDQAWAPIFWNYQLELDCLASNREQAWKDLAEYRSRFKDEANPAYETLVNGI